MSSKFIAAGMRVTEEAHCLLTAPAQSHAISTLRNVNLAPNKLRRKLGSAGSKWDIWWTPTVPPLNSYWFEKKCLVVINYKFKLCYQCTCNVVAKHVATMEGIAKNMALRETRREFSFIMARSYLKNCICSGYIWKKKKYHLLRGLWTSWYISRAG